LYAEPDAGIFAHRIDRASRRSISAGTYVEAAIIAERHRSPIATRRFDDFIREARIVVEPVSVTQAKIAREAYRDYGKGSGHPAQLNFGDCFAYALARDRAEPLLFKGNDFSQTDVRSALRQPEPN
jgi:ribonuclease VapC